MNLPEFPFLPKLRTLRRDIHAHPELAFKETRTSVIIARELANYGLEVHRGLAHTGVVGVLRAGQGERVIGLRADMDALPIREQNSFSYQSAYPDCMHACGHDGHIAMLLGAARHLATHPDFDGTVVFIFQPAEEAESGAKAMIEDKLFERFPLESVYGLHNWPDLPLGTIAVHTGPVMAGSCRMEIRIGGRGCHAAMPQKGVNPIIAASHLIDLLHNIKTHEISPLEPAVISITQIHAGATWNAIPDETILKGTLRSFDASAQETIEAAIHRVCQGVALSTGTKIECQLERRYPPTLNSRPESETCLAVARKLLGEENALYDLRPAMTAEDFSFMLQEKPGCYVWLGTGKTNEKAANEKTTDGNPERTPPLHSPRYDFNDKALPVGIAYWVALVQEILGKPAPAETA